MRPMANREDIQRLRLRLEKVMELRGLNKARWSMRAGLGKNMLQNFFGIWRGMSLAAMRALSSDAGIPLEALTLDMDDTSFQRWLAAEREKAKSLDLLRRQRKLLRVPLSSVADALGCNADQADRLLDGSAPISESHLGGLARALKISPDTLRRVICADQPAPLAAEDVGATFAAPSAIDSGILAEVIEAVTAIESSLPIPLDKESKARLIAETYQRLARKGTT